MRGWILYKTPPRDWKPDAYEMPRYLRTAEENGIEIRVVTPDKFDLIVTRDDRKSVRVDGEVLPLPDFLLPRMGAGTTYYALAVIRHLERLGVYSVNKSSSIEIVKDKLYTQQVLAASDLPFAKTMLARFPIDVGLVEQTFGFPVIVKTISGTHGTGVYLCETRNTFEDLMSMVCHANGSAILIIQEFVADSFGRDLRVITIGGRAVACMQRKARPGSFKANIASGGKAERFEMTPEIEWLASEASRICDLDLAGVDLLFDGEHYKICEVNSSPGFRGLESCHDISIPKMVYDYIRIRLNRF